MLILIHFQDVTQNENWNNCLDINGQSLARCIYNCKNDESCETDCVGRFKLKTDDCPCEVTRLMSSPPWIFEAFVIALKVYTDVLVFVHALRSW